MTHFHPNTAGGLTHASAQAIGTDQRCDFLAPVRQSADLLDELVAQVRSYWPLNYPVPPEIAALLAYHETSRAMLRDGRLKKLAEVCNASD